METPQESCDDPTGIPVSLPGPGYIANLVTEATGCGGVHSPWLIAAQPGQTVRLSLFDFTLASPSSRRRCADSGASTTTRRPGSVDPAGPCPPLAVVREPLVDAARDWHNVTVPAGLHPSHGTVVSSRDNLVYVSQGHVVQVAILTSKNAADVPYFMVKYEGKRRL